MRTNVAGACGARGWLSVSVLLLGMLGCVQEQRYVVEDQFVIMRHNTPVAYVDDDENPTYIAERRFQFPITRPSNAKLRELAQKAQGKRLPYPRLPWVESSDLELQLDYALVNREETPVVAGIILNGINEFNEYAPLGPEQLNQWEKRFALEPGQRVTGTISELEMEEIAVDLSTVVNGAPNSNQVVFEMSQSSRDPRIKRYIPSVIAGLVGIRVGISSSSASHLVLELSVRAQDHGGRLAERDESRWELPAPTLFTPVAPEMDL